MFKRETQFELGLPESEREPNSGSKLNEPKEGKKINIKRRRVMRLERRPEKIPPYNSKLSAKEARLQETVINGIIVKSGDNPRIIFAEMPAANKGGFYKMAFSIVENNGVLKPIIDVSPGESSIPENIKESMTNAVEEYLSNFKANNNENNLED